jgi:hypothetical protein
MFERHIDEKILTSNEDEQEKLKKIKNIGLEII